MRLAPADLIAAHHPVKEGEQAGIRQFLLHNVRPGGRGNGKPGSPPLQISQQLPHPGLDGQQPRPVFLQKEGSGCFLKAVDERPVPIGVEQDLIGHVGPHPDAAQGGFDDAFHPETLCRLRAAVDIQPFRVKDHAVHVKDHGVYRPKIHSAHAAIPSSVSKPACMLSFYHIPCHVTYHITGTAEAQRRNCCFFCPSHLRNPAVPWYYI